MITVKRPLPSARPGSRTRSLLAASVAAIVGVITLTSSTARAEGPDTDYCKKVTARADADAALLFAPTLSAQLIRYPQSAILDTLGVQVGRDVQPRAALSIGVLDIYKGFGVQDVAKNDCARQATAISLQEMILSRDDASRKYAITKKLDFLKERDAEVQKLLKQSEERFVAGTTTLVEVQDLRRKILETANRTAEAEKSLASIEAKATPTTDESIDKLVTKYEEQSVAYEKSVEHVRNLSPWKLSVTAGGTVHPQLDYFGAIELTYNFGGIFSIGAEARAREARASELKNARYEMRQQVETLRRDLRAQTAIITKQIALIDAELANTQKVRATVEKADAPSKPHMLAVLSLQVIDLESERVFLTALTERPSAIGGGK